MWPSVVGTSNSTHYFTFLVDELIQNLSHLISNYEITRIDITSNFQIEVDLLENLKNRIDPCNCVLLELLVQWIIFWALDSWISSYDMFWGCMFPLLQACHIPLKYRCSTIEEWWHKVRIPYVGGRMMT